MRRRVSLGPPTASEQSGGPQSYLNVGGFLRSSLTDTAKVDVEITPTEEAMWMQSGLVRLI
jgi:hypothetical protein